MEKVLCDEMEDKVLHIFLYDGVSYIKVEEKTSKNQEEIITMEAKKS